ncbi:MAG TPA: hypothetical protein VMS31_09275 [Pyrinomonadaceae bacterium]|nr:hypothetical protein [Pyrinomonadaceae bacterium]
MTINPFSSNAIKTKSMQLLALIVFLSFAPASSAQTKSKPVTTTPTSDRAIVTPRKVVITRRGALLRNFPEKKTATLTYPGVSGLKDQIVLRRVQSILQVKNVFDTSLAEYREDTWLEEFGYKVNYNQHHILDITFTQSGSGAYPDTHTKHFAINLKNGSAIKASDVFVPDKLEPLRKMLDQKLQSELKSILRDLGESKSDPEDIAIAKEAGEILEFKVENLDDFSVGSKGITFLYDAGYPHAIQAFEPEGSYFLSYSELRPYIKRDGILGQFVQ